VTRPAFVARAGDRRLFTGAASPARIFWLSYAQEGLRSARFPIEGYEELSVKEVSARLEGLSPDELRVVRDYEERTKRRVTPLEQLDSKIREGL
jgi:hypothetical protein